MKITITLDNSDFGWCESQRAGQALREEYEKAVEAYCKASGFADSKLTEIQAWAHGTDDAVILDLEKWQLREIPSLNPKELPVQTSADTAILSALDVIQELHGLDQKYSDPQVEEEMVRELEGDDQIAAWELSREDI